MLKPCEGVVRAANLCRVAVVIISLFNLGFNTDTAGMLYFILRSGWSTVKHCTQEEILQYGSIHLPYSSK